MSDVRDISVIHLVWLPYGIDHFKVFINSYINSEPNYKHQLIIAFNGMALEYPNKINEYLSFMETRNVKADKCLYFDNGQDIEIYQKSAAAVNTKFVFIFNTFSEIGIKNWLKYYIDNFTDQVGVISATSSYQSNYSTVFQTHPFKWESAKGFLYNYRKYKLFIKALFYWRFLFKPYPNPHVRTTGFMVRREEFLSINPGRINNKFKAYQFESGRKGMTNYYLKKGLKVLVMDKFGKTYGPDEFKNSDTFWIGEQENLLVSDNQTRIYRDADPAYRKLLTKLAWGINE